MKNKKAKIYFLFITVPVIILFLNAVSYAQSSKKGKTVNTIGFMQGLFSSVNINDAQAGVRIWISKIVKNNSLFDKYNVNVKIYDDINQVLSQKSRDNLSTLSLTTPDYIIYGSKLGLEPVLVPSIDDEAGSEYYLLVNKNKNYNNLEDLKNTVIGLTSEESHKASVLWLDVTLAKNHLPQKEKFFNKIEYSEKESKLILNLFFGQTDACLVSNHDFRLMKELNPQIGNKLKIIATSPEYLWGLVCFTKSFDDAEKNIFSSSALKFQNLTSGKQLFSLLKMDKLIPFRKEYLETYKTLLKEYNNLIRGKNY